MVLADAPSARGGAWAFDDTIVYAPGGPLFRIPATGGTPEPLTALDREAGEWTHAWPAVLSDGTVLYASGLGYIKDPKTEFDIVIASLDDRKSMRPFVRTPFREITPAFSPDGRWIAYASDESGRYEVYVQAYPDPRSKWQISTDGGNRPRWAKNGRELFYQNGDRIMSVEVQTTPAFRLSARQILFDQRGDWDVSPDGQRFLIMKSTAQAEMPELDVILNWHEELKRRVPTK